MVLNKTSSNHQKNLFVATIICVFAIVLTIMILNFSFGLIVYYLDQNQSIWWNKHSPLLLGTVIFIMLISLFYELYIFRVGGHSLAKQMRARYLNTLECTPEEIRAVKLTEQLANKFEVMTPSVYVLPDEIGVNALTAGQNEQDTVIILTWGALQNLDELELYGLLSYAFNQILSGETRQNIRLKILFSALTSFNQWGSKIARRGFKPYNSKNKFETVLVALGGIIWLMGSLGLLISRFVKFVTLSGRTFKNDTETQALISNDTNLQTLLRIYVHHAGSQIHSSHSESIAHMCFANSLSPQSWLNIHPNIERRIYQLDPSILKEVQLENLKRVQAQPLFSLFRPFGEEQTEVSIAWEAPQPFPLVRLSPISFSSQDEEQPLSPHLRQSMKQPELLKRALQTGTGAREVIVAVLMIRQYREFIPKDAQVSHAIVDALLAIDGRLHVQVFYNACNKLVQMPMSIARQFLTRLALIIQADGEVGLLDVLLLEKVKSHLNLLPIHMPTAYDETQFEIVRLVDALVHVQKLNSSNQLKRRASMLAQLVSNKEIKKYEHLSDDPVNLGEILHHLSGLLLRDRLKILGVLEHCLSEDRIITQDELDVLVLLYWRLGFENKEVVEQVLKQNSLMIV